MNGVTSASTATAGTASAAAASSAAGSQTAQQGTMISSDFETFLRLLTTQIRNQDPLNPMESTEFAQQLATFSGVEQQVRTNTLLQSLSDRLALSGMAQFAPWVGMEARVDGAVMFSGAPLTLYPAPAAGADQAVLVVHDAQGREVQRSPAAVSTSPIDWAGTDASGAPLPAGPYSFTIESYQGGQLIGTSAVQAYDTITEVRNGASGTEFVLRGGSTVTVADIAALRSPSG